MRTAAIWRLVVGTVCLHVVVLGGCGAAEEEQVVELAPPVDPRYATADALLAYVNRLNASRNGADLYNVTSLYYAENDLQRRITRLIGDTMPMADLGLAFIEVFGDSMPRDLITSLDVKPGQEARIVQRLDRRVIAESRKPNGTKSQLHLIEYNGRWWISGYSFEYDADVKRLLKDPEELEAIEMAMRVFAPICKPMAQRVRAREFDSPTAVVAAMAHEMAMYSMRNPQEAEKLRRMIEKESGYPLGPLAITRNRHRASDPGNAF